MRCERCNKCIERIDGEVVELENYKPPMISASDLMATPMKELIVLDILNMMMETEHVIKAHIDELSEDELLMIVTHMNPIELMLRKKI